MTQKTQEPTTKEILTEAQKRTNTHSFPALDPSYPSTPPTLKELPKEHKDIIDQLAVPFAVYERNLVRATLQPVRWLWQKRVPFAGITLLDGDHGCGKSLLALQLAACVSSGSLLPDGSPSIQGGVVIVSPNTDATTTQFQLLTSFGADLSRIEILSYIQEPAPEFHTGGYRPFSLPEDFLSLFLAIKRVDARLVIFDPFITLLSHNSRWTNERLGQLLTALNQRLIERNIACLLIRNCPAKGGHARPTVLEKSDHFVTTAVSRLLLSPDPFQPDRHLLSHALNRHAALSPTLSLRIQPSPANLDLPQFTLLGSHSLEARDFIECRPDTLHRRLLSQHLLSLITDSTDPVHVATLHARSPHSSPFQIQRSLKDLLNMGQIERPARGFYSPAAIPVFTSSQTAATTSPSEPASLLNQTPTRAPIPEPVTSLNGTAATRPIPEPVASLNGTAARTEISEPAASLNGTAATRPIPEPVTSLNGTAATRPIPEPVTSLNGTAARTEISEPVSSLWLPCGHWSHTTWCKCHTF